MQTTLMLLYRHESAYMLQGHLRPLFPCCEWRSGTPPTGVLLKARGGDLRKGAHADRSRRQMRGLTDRFNTSRLCQTSKQNQILEIAIRNTASLGSSKPSTCCGVDQQICRGLTLQYAAQEMESELVASNWPNGRSMAVGHRLHLHVTVTTQKRVQKHTMI